MKPGISEWKSVRNTTQISVQNSAEFSAQNSAQNSAQISAQISARNTCNSAEFRAKRSEFTHHHPSPDPTLQPTTPESSAESTIPSTHLENMCISTSTDGTTRRISAQISAEFSAQNSALISPADLQVPAEETPLSPQGLNPPGGGRPDAGQLKYAEPMIQVCICILWTFNYVHPSFVLVEQESQNARFFEKKAPPIIQPKIYMSKVHKKLPSGFATRAQL